MTTWHIDGTDYPITDFSGVKAPFSSIQGGVTLINRLDSTIKSLRPQLEKLSDQLYQYRSTNGHLMVEIDRLNQRIAELADLDGAA